MAHVSEQPRALLQNGPSLQIAMQLVFSRQSEVMRRQDPQTMIVALAMLMLYLRSVCFVELSWS